MNDFIEKYDGHIRKAVILGLWVAVGMMTTSTDSIALIGEHINLENICKTIYQTTKYYKNNEYTTKLHDININKISTLSQDAHTQTLF